MSTFRMDENIVAYSHNAILYSNVKKQTKLYSNKMYVLTFK